MKLKKRVKKTLRTILLIIILIFLMFVIYDVGLSTDTKEKINNYIAEKTGEKIVSINDFNYNTSSRLNIEEEKIIKNFLSSYYLGIATLKPKNLGSYFSLFEGQYLTETALNLLIEIRKQQEVDLTMLNVNVDITIENINNNNNEIIISFLESYYCNFTLNSSVTSKNYNIESSIILEKVNDDYKIYSYDRSEDFYAMITNNYEISGSKSNESVTSDLDSIKLRLIDEETVEINKQKQLMEDYNLGNVSYSNNCDNDYNRNLAYKYAIEYVHIRNTNNYPSFDDYGGNCQNYGSQVLYAGGIPKDTVESSIWKYYGTTPDQSNSRYGRSKSWSAVGDFYMYAKNNTGYGLCAIVDANTYAAEAGDIIQVSDDQSNYAHTVVAIDTIKDSDGKVVDIIINSNTTDRENYPLSAYNYPYKRLIKILGWNN